MTANLTPSVPSPFPILEALDAYQITAVLKGAIELEVFTHIADGATSALEVARRANASERGIRILCDFLTIRGFLTKVDGTYGLTAESAAFLNKRSPAYLGSIAYFFAHDYHMSHFRDIAAVVRKGGSIGEGNMAPDDPIWVEFAQDMAPLSMAARPLISLISEPGRPIKVLDIAAGPGMYGIMVAQNNPAAEIVAVDWGNVLEIARGNAAKFGVTERYRTIPGSAFEVDFGGGYDLVLLTQFLHHFDPPTNIGLLKKIHAAMKPGARLATIEMMPNDDRVSPPFTAAFSMMMLASTPAGDAYTFRELEEMFRNAGFGESVIQTSAQTPLPIILTSA